MFGFVHGLLICALYQYICCMKSLRKYTVLFIMAGVMLVCGGWGFLVHQTGHQLAVYQLPVGMQRFFYKNMQYLTDSSIRPDLRRGRDSTEATKHFIDLEVYGKDAALHMPLAWNEAVAKYTRDTLRKYGYVPYWVIDMKNKLTKAFAAHNADSILFYAADLGHYVEDANVPLHTTTNYDGQLTAQKGIHALWESVSPDVEIGSYNLYTTHKATYLMQPELAIWQAVRRANALLPGLFATEKEVSARFADADKYKTVQKYGKTFKYYTESFAAAYGKALKPTINNQLIYSANLVADFWYTAWVDAGKPNLDALLSKPFNAADNTLLNKQLNAFKQNTLVKDSLLNALKSNHWRD